MTADVPTTKRGAIPGGPDLAQILGPDTWPIIVGNAARGCRKYGEPCGFFAYVTRMLGGRRVDHVGGPEGGLMALSRQASFRGRRPGGEVRAVIVSPIGRFHIPARRSWSPRHIAFHRTSNRRPRGSGQEAGRWPE